MNDLPMLPNGCLKIRTCAECKMLRELFANRTKGILPAPDVTKIIPFNLALMRHTSFKILLFIEMG